MLLQKPAIRCARAVVAHHFLLCRLAVMVGLSDRVSANRTQKPGEVNNPTAKNHKLYETGCPLQRPPVMVICPTERSVYVVQCRGD